MVNFSETYESPMFYILAGVGVGAVMIMLMVLKGMGQSEIMPTWIKIVSLVSAVGIAYIWASFMEG